MRDERQHEAAGRPAVAAFARADLVKRCKRQPAAERRVKRRDAQRKPRPGPTRLQVRGGRNAVGGLSARRIERQPIVLGKAAFDCGDVPAQAAKHRLRRGVDGHGGLGYPIVLYLFSSCHRPKKSQAARFLA